MVLLCPMQGLRMRANMGHGRPARIICTDRVGERPIVALIMEDDGSAEWCSYFPSDGEGRGLVSLRNVPEKHVRWVNFYPYGCAGKHRTRDEADDFAAEDRIACIRVEFEEGEGLDD